MESYIPASYQCRLHHQENNPSAEHGSMHLDENIANVRVIDSGQIVGAGESKKYRAHNQQHHRPKVEIVGASPGSGPSYRREELTLRNRSLQLGKPYVPGLLLGNAGCDTAMCGKISSDSLICPQ